MERLHGFLIVPYRITFSPVGVWQWTLGLAPMAWHYWTELTDLRRISFARRREILWDWWMNRPPTMPVPFEAHAVGWWLSRLMRGRHWDWDRHLTAEHLGVKIGDFKPGHAGEFALRGPIREFLFPAAANRFFTSDLAYPEDDHVYIPPISAYHLRLRTMRHSRAGWISATSLTTPEPGDWEPEGATTTRVWKKSQTIAPMPADAVPVIWHAARLHQFRFGDGFISLSFTLDRDELADADEQNAAMTRLWDWCDTPDRLRVAFQSTTSSDADGAEPSGIPERSPIPWAERSVLTLRETAQLLLTPPQLYDRQVPEQKTWHFAWQDSLDLDSTAHRIEFPLASQLPCLFIAGEATTPLSMHEAELKLQDWRVRATPMMMDDAHDGDGDGTGGTNDEKATPAETPPAAAETARTSERRAAVSAQRIEPPTHWHALMVFVLALFRRVKVSQVGDMVATSRGTQSLASARYLQSLAFHVGLARDRFLGDSPVFGGWLATLWQRLDSRWESGAMLQRITPVIDSYRDGFFRDRSLRLVARVTSTFWFLFRWILLPILLVKFLALFGAAVVVGVVAVLILSLFATVAILIANIVLGRMSGGLAEVLDLDGEESGEADESSESGETRIVKRSRMPRVMTGVAAAELLALIVMALIWPEIGMHVLPYLGLYVLVLLLIAGIAVAVLRWSKQLNRRTVAEFFQRETFPIMSAILAVMLAIAVGVFVLYFFGFFQGWDALTVRFWEVWSQP